jgi:bifunctional non-homologous end joining protein LigD
MSLKKYHEKRDFAKTKEPKGSLNASKSKSLSGKTAIIKKNASTNKTPKVIKEHQPIYLIQKHAASHLHYDLRLEMEGVLKSWAVPKGPSLDSHLKRLAVEVEDHPIEYGSFEGTIPKGQYGGGTVMLWDTGSYKTIHNDALSSLKKGDLTFEIKGQKLKGLWKLIKLHQKPGHVKSRDFSSHKNYWLFFKLPDKYEKEGYDITLKKPLSVKTKRNLDEIAHIYPKRMNFRCRHCEAHHVDLYYDNIYGLKQSRVLRPFLDCFTSAVATVRNDAPFKHHLKMKRFEYIYPKRMNFRRYLSVRLCER